MSIETKQVKGLEMKVELLGYENNLADFEVVLGNGDLLTCHATIDLIDFKNGDSNVKPYAWFDLEENEIDKPEFNGVYAQYLFNECFEKSVGNFL